MFNVILECDMPFEFKGMKRAYPLKTDFKQGLKFFRIVADQDLPEQLKYELILVCFFGEGLVVDREDVKGIFDFISGYISGEEKGDEGKKVFDFNIDHGRLFSAFLQVYGLDLRIAKLHWWTFLELFKGIPGSTRLMEIIDLRAKPVPKDGSKEYKSALRSAKAKYSLNSEEDEKAKADAIMKMMMS